MGTEDRGFASMDEDKQREIASKGGQASSSSNSSSTDGKMSRSEAGKKGAAAQPTEAKAKGGHNSHSNR